MALTKVDSRMVEFTPAGTGAVVRDVQTKLREIVSRNDYGTDANYKAARDGKFSIDGSSRTFAPFVVAGTKSFGSAGDDWPGTAGLRDAFTASRDLTGLTDCHAFADKTIIDQVTDSGTYGAFDATTRLKGSHTQNHVFSFQDRIDYQGSGTLQTQAGLYSAPTLSGSGTITVRYGAEIFDVNVTGAGAVGSQIGLYIRDLNAAGSNVAINTAQATGYALYAAGGAKSYHLGSFGIGIDPGSGIKLHVDGGSGTSDVAIHVAKTGGYSYYASGTGKFWQAGQASFGTSDNSADGVSLTVRGGVTGPRAFLHSTSTLTQTGSIGGDFVHQTVTNGATRLEITASSGAYAVRPGADNSQPLGDATKRWSQLFAGTATINTSDLREKQDIEELSAAEKRVAVALKGLIRKFRFIDSVRQKGDDARIHVGVIAQEVVSAFEDEGLDSRRYSIVCYDEWPAEFDEEGNEVRPAGNRYGIRYEELMSFIIAVL